MYVISLYHQAYSVHYKWGLSVRTTHTTPVHLGTNGWPQNAGKHVSGHPFRKNLGGGGGHMHNPQQGGHCGFIHKLRTSKLPLILEQPLWVGAYALVTSFKLLFPCNFHTIFVLSIQQRQILISYNYGQVWMVGSTGLPQKGSILPTIHPFINVLSLINCCVCLCERLGMCVCEELQSNMWWTAIVKDFNAYMYLPALSTGGWHNLMAGCICNFRETWNGRQCNRAVWIITVLFGSDKCQSNH